MRLGISPLPTLPRSPRRPAKPIGCSLWNKRASRFQAMADNPDRADPDSEVVLINQFDRADNHNGGDLHFGPDGFLYVAVGDGGEGGDYENSQQIAKNFFSGLLRLDVDKRA